MTRRRIAGASLARAVLLVMLAGCGRIGFDAGGATCGGSSPTSPVHVAPGPTALTLCRGTSWLAVDAPEGAEVAIAIEVEASDVTAVGVDLLGPDQVALAGPTWGPAVIETAAIATIEGTQLVRIEADLELAARLTATITPPTGRVVHLATDGNDLADGSAATPWQTWPRALGRLQPGDVLIVHDGTWTDVDACASTPCLAGTARAVADCTAGAHSGLPTAPITVIAQHQRRAHVHSSGRAPAFRLESCGWWVVDGLHGSSADAGTDDQFSGSVFSFDNDPDVVVRHLLVDHPNRCGNNHGIGVGGTIAGSPRALVEDCEVYDFHRGALFTADSPNVTFRRNYVHSRDASDGVCSASSYAERGDYGADCYNFQRQPSCVFENLIAEDVALAFTGPEATAFELTGSIARDAYFGAYLGTNSTPPVIPPTARAITDLVCLDCDIGAWNRAQVMTVTGATFVGGRARKAPGYGFGVEADQLPMTAPRSTLRDVLVLDYERGGFEIANQLSWLITYSTAAGTPSAYTPVENIGDDLGNIQHSLTTVPTLVGDTDGACLVYVPAGSNMAHAGDAGGPIGATVVQRSVGGVLTDRKLWNQRTGAFPCGAIVPGVNDVPGASCFDVHRRLRVGVAGCAIP